MKRPARPSSLATWDTSAAAHLLLVQPFMDSVIARGEGCYMIDADGRRILDLAAGQFCSILGYNHPRFVARMQEQVARLVHLGDQYVSAEVIEACAALAAVSPANLTKALLLSTGSEANECAMRMAKTVTARTGMLGYTRGYYGISLATHNLSSISDHPRRHDFQPAPSGQHKLLTPNCRRCPVGLAHDACNGACLDASLELVGSHLDTIAAVIVEPIVSAGGMIYPSTAYLRMLYQVSREHGFLFIVDEAQTGFGRCGQWFDIQNHGIEPDIMVVSKTAGNGYPAAAIIVSDEVGRKLESASFTHLSSHQNDPLAAAAILAVIEVVREENLVENSRRQGEYFLAGLETLKARHPLVKDVRGRGLMIGIELDAEGPDAASRALKATMLCEQRDVHVTFTFHEPVLRIIPPLTISRAEIDHALQVLDDVLSELEGGGVDLLEIISENRRSGPFVRQMVHRSPAAFARKMWTTSPAQWVGKLRSIRERAR